jgi:hypothetical protein
MEIRAMPEVKESFDNKRWLIGVVLAVVIAGAASAGLSLLGFKGGPVLIGGGWVAENSGTPLISRADRYNGIRKHQD